jgi:hypothetical protein
MRILLLFCLGKAATAGPTVTAVHVACEKGFLCPASQIDLVTIDATKPDAVTTIANLIPTEKSKLTRRTKTLSAKSIAGDSIYVLVLDPAKPSPVLITVNTTSNGVMSSSPVSTMLFNTTTLDIFPEPIGLIASTQGGKFYRINDTQTGSIVALPIALPIGLVAGGQATTDGVSRLWVFCHTPDPTPSTVRRSDPRDDDPVPAEGMWYAAECDLQANTVTLSAGAHYGEGYPDSTDLIGMHFNTSSDTASAFGLIDTFLGAMPGRLDLTNVSNFTPLTGGMLPVIYLDYNPVDKPQSTFLVHDVLFALMNYVDDSEEETRMTWVNFSAHHPPIHFEKGGDELSDILPANNLHAPPF